MLSNSIENIKEFTHSGTNIYVLFVDNTYLVIRTYPKIVYSDCSHYGQSYLFNKNRSAVEAYSFLMKLKHFYGWVEGDEGDFVRVLQ